MGGINGFRHVCTEFGPYLDDGSSRDDKFIVEFVITFEHINLIN